MSPAFKLRTNWIWLLHWPFPRHTFPIAINRHHEGAQYRGDQIERNCSTRVRTWSCCCHEIPSVPVHFSSQSGTGEKRNASSACTVGWKNDILIAMRRTTCVSFWYSLPIWWNELTVVWTTTMLCSIHIFPLESSDRTEILLSTSKLSKRKIAKLLNS